MVLEALGAFALACNILQVIEYGTKAAKNARSLHRSEAGFTTELDDLQALAKQLEELNVDLGSNAISNPAPQLTVQNRLTECNNESLRLSRKFITFVASLQPEQPRLPSKLSWAQSFKASIRSKWHQEEIDALQKAVSQARSNLILACLLYMS